MSLVPAWMRALGRASGAALLVPAGVFGAMVVLALAGSFGQLGRLGQVFAGPAVPSVAPPGASALVAPGGRATLLPGAGAGAAALASTSPGVGARGGAPAPPSAAPPGRPLGGGTSGGGGGSTTPPTGRCGRGCAPVGPKPTAIEQVVALGTSVTSTLPGPIGPLATQALEQLGATVGQMLPATFTRTGTSARTTLSGLGSTIPKLR